MSELHRRVEDYLRLRRALGFKLRLHGDLLPHFADYLEAAGAAAITTELAVSFAQLPQGVQPILWAHRLTMVRGFARYLKTIDPATEVPPLDVFGARYQRPTPYLWQEAEVLRLMKATGRLQPAMACQPGCWISWPRQALGLRPAVGGQAGDRHGARRAGLAWLLPGRRRAHQGDMLLHRDRLIALGSTTDAKQRAVAAEGPKVAPDLPMVPFARQADGELCRHVNDEVTARPLSRVRDVLAGGRISDGFLPPGQFTCRRAPSPSRTWP